LEPKQLQAVVLSEALAHVELH